MSKIILTMGTSYCGCPSETTEIEYYGTEREFDRDDEVSTEILNAILNSEFPHYFLDIEFVEEEDEEE